MKILPVGAELFRVDRQTDMTKIIILRNFANAHKTTCQSFLYRTNPPTHGVVIKLYQLV